MKAAIELPSEKVAKLRVRSRGAERADEVVDRDVEEDVAEADQRGAGEEAPQRGKQRRTGERDRHDRAAEEHRIAHAEAVGDPSRVHREQQRKASRTARASTPTANEPAPSSSA